MKIELNNIYDVNYKPSSNVARELADELNFELDDISVTCTGNNIILEGSRLNEGFVLILTRLVCLDYIKFCGKQYETTGFKRRFHLLNNQIAI